MTAYKNLSGESNVIGYEFQDDGIAVRFKDLSTYIYTNDSAGAHHIEQMKTLAVAGLGLNRYIMEHVRYAYER